MFPASAPAPCSLVLVPPPPWSSLVSTLARWLVVVAPAGPLGCSRRLRLGSLVLLKLRTLVQICLAAVLLGVCVCLASATGLALSRGALLALPSCVSATLSTVGLGAASLACLGGAGCLVGLVLALAFWLVCVVVGADLPCSRCWGGWLGLAELGFRRSAALRLCRLLVAVCHTPPSDSTSPSSSVPLELSGSTPSRRSGCRALPLGHAALCRSSASDGAVDTLRAVAASCRAELALGCCSAVEAMIWL